ncbi:MAG TPA: fluoride efflux transporter CrcB [Longimicrobium sp.]|nr:fluoride efflux transporter CrcB [Longimicrobium sp.]
MIYLYLAAGGVLGTLARYGIGKWAVGQAAHAFPWHTFAINLAGSLVLGFAMRASVSVALSPETRGFVTVGFCGAFTTFSTFSWETVVMIEQGQWGRAAAYALGSVAAGIACVLLGMWMASAILRPRT